MSRLSDEAKSITPPPEALLPTESPPPSALGERERQEWQAIIARLGPQWLPRECHALLEAFCNIKIQLQTVSAALAEFGGRVPEDRQGWGRYKELSRMRGLLANQLCSLSTKLRLAPSARNDRHWAGAEARRRGSRPPPWSLGDEDPMVG
jgi:phage terminase small subunit